MMIWDIAVMIVFSEEYQRAGGRPSERSASPIQRRTAA